MDAITKQQQAFEAQLSFWALTNGYKRRGHLWRKPDHYLTIVRDSSDAPFVVQKTAYGSGAMLERLSI
jgi:hypothetical protein